MTDTTKTKQEKKISLSEIEKEITQLTDLAQAVNARCFFLREELRLNHKKS